MNAERGGPDDKDLEIIGGGQEGKGLPPDGRPGPDDGDSL